MSIYDQPEQSNQYIAPFRRWDLAISGVLKGFSKKQMVLCNVKYTLTCWAQSKYFSQNRDSSLKSHKLCIRWVEIEKKLTVFNWQVKIYNATKGGEIKHKLQYTRRPKFKSNQTESYIA